MIYQMDITQPTETAMCACMDIVCVCQWVCFPNLPLSTYHNLNQNSPGKHKYSEYRLLKTEHCALILKVKPDYRQTQKCKIFEEKSPGN